MADGNLPVQELGGLLRARSFAEHIERPADDAEKIDIVLVPGIYADSDGVWNTRFPHATVHTIFDDLPQARILMYSHDREENASLKFFALRLLNWVKLQREPDQRDRPLHFAAHSTGGIVVKKALVIAHHDPMFRQISRSCNSVSFFGVPHQGSSVLSQELFAESVKAHLHMRIPLGSDLRDVFNPGSAELIHLDQDFAIRARRLWRIWTMVETKETSLNGLYRDRRFSAKVLKQVNAFIVDSRSATLQVGNEVVLALDCSHSELCTFPAHSPVSQRYLRSLAELIEDSASNMEDTLEKTIRASLKVDVHEFLETQTDSKSSSFHVLSVQPNLQTLLEEGPSSCLSKRLEEDATDHIDEGLSQPAVDHRPVPEIRISGTDGDEIAVDQNNASGQSDRRESITAKPNPTRLPPAPAPRHAGRFIWIHVPSNNPSWALDVFDTVAIDQCTANPHERIFNEHVWQSRHNLSHYGIPHSRRMRPLCNWIKDDSASEVTSSNSERNARMILYLPYLHWDTLASLKLRTRRIEERKNWKKPHTPREVLLMWPTEHQQLWKHLHGYGNLEIHHRRSLDQYGYPSLSSTKARDLDQVLNKHNLRMSFIESTAEPLPQDERVPTGDFTTRMGLTRQPTIQECTEAVRKNDVKKDGGKVLMVDQLWLYITDQNTVVTFFPPKEEEPGEKDGLSKIASLRTSIYNDINGDPRFATFCRNPLELAALIVKHAVRVLLGQVTDEELQVFQIFESYISHLAEAQTKSFKNFRLSQERRYHNRDAGSQSRELSQEEQDRDTEDSIRDLRNLTELRDVDDELTTIRNLLTEQLDVVASMQRQLPEKRLAPPSESKSNTRNLLREAENEIEAYRAQIDRLKVACKSAHDAYVFLLDMRDKQANVYEARQSRKSAQLATRQNRSIVFFTIFTIIFLPLSFFTSLFGMNVREWSANPKDPSLRLVFTITWPLSIAVIIFALGLAYSKPIRKTVGRLFRFAGAVIAVRILLPLVTKLAPSKEKHDVESGLAQVAGPRSHWLWTHMENTTGIELERPEAWGKVEVEQVEKMKTSAATTSVSQLSA